MRLARLIRAETLSAKEYDYVVYSKFTGVKATTILKRHILPAIIPTLVVAASSSIANAIMTEAALSFFRFRYSTTDDIMGNIITKCSTELAKCTSYGDNTGIICNVNYLLI